MGPGSRWWGRADVAAICGCEGRASSIRGCGCNGFLLRLVLKAIFSPVAGGSSSASQPPIDRPAAAGSLSELTLPFSEPSCRGCCRTPPIAISCGCCCCCCCCCCWCWRSSDELPDLLTRPLVSAAIQSDIFLNIIFCNTCMIFVVFWPIERGPKVTFSTDWIKKNTIFARRTHKEPLL